jgi:hypothetical protein
MGGPFELGNAARMEHSLLASTIGVCCPKVQMPAVATTGHMQRLENFKRRGEIAARRSLSKSSGRLNNGIPTTVFSLANTVGWHIRAKPARI